MTTPNRGSKPKRSYLEKGPTREQLERRNLLKGKLLFGDDDDDEDDFSGPFSGPFSKTSTDRDTRIQEDEGLEPTRQAIRTNGNDNAKKRMSLSLSPKNFGKRLGVRSRAERNNNALTKSDVGGYMTRRERPIDILVSPVRQPPPRSRSNMSTKERPAVPSPMRQPPRRSRSNMTRKERPADASPTRQAPERSRSNTTGNRWSIMGEGRSLSPRQMLRRSVLVKQKANLNPTINNNNNNTNGKKESGLEDMRKSLMADKKQLDDLQSKFKTMDDDDDDGPIDDETMLERVARRVAERRGKLQRNKTDGDNIVSMQMALKRRQEMEREGDEGIGGLWAMGLKALERVYDDINNTKRDSDEE